MKDYCKGYNIIDSGGSRGEAPCLFLDQTEARGAKNFLFLILHPLF